MGELNHSRPKGLVGFSAAARPESPRERRIAVPCCLEMESAVRARGGPPAYRGGVFGHRRLQGGAEGRGELGSARAPKAGSVRRRTITFSSDDSQRSSSN